MSRLPEHALVTREQALSIEHRTTHFPKNALCDICNRARLCSKRIRSHRAENPGSDLHPPEDIAAELAMDHLTVSTGSVGKEFVVLLICDGFSNVMQAVPLDHHVVQECLLKFIGTHEGQTRILKKHADLFIYKEALRLFQRCGLTLVSTVPLL